MRSRIEKWIRYYFGISRTEANGVIILVIIILMATFLPLFISGLSKTYIIDPGEEQRLDSLVAVLDQRLIPVDKDDVHSETNDSITYFTFDPNTSDLDDLLKLGLGSEISNRILKYRERGGRFDSKGDLAKIYGLGKDKYEELLPFIYIEEIVIDSTVVSHKMVSESLENFDNKDPVEFDINKIDSSELIIINGVGDILSGRIVRFRESLGGFVSMDQLLDVYGLEEYAFENLSKQAYIDNNFVPRGVRINDWTADTLARHPYIDFRKAKVIVAYREQHGRYQKPADLKEILILDEDWVDRMSPYLEF